MKKVTEQQITMRAEDTACQAAGSVVPDNTANCMSLRIRSLSRNEAFARSAVAAFAAELNPTVDEIGDIKTAVSEAVTNCVVHAYDDGEGMITVNADISGGTLHIEVIDEGRGIDDIERARKAFYTTKPDAERSGMGFTVMETFMDSLEVLHNEPKGTIVKMSKRLCAEI